MDALEAESETGGDGLRKRGIPAVDIAGTRAYHLPPGIGGSRSGAEGAVEIPARLGGDFHPVILAESVGICRAGDGLRGQGVRPGEPAAQVADACGDPEAFQHEHRVCIAGKGRISRLGAKALVIVPSPYSYAEKAQEPVGEACRDEQLARSGAFPRIAVFVHKGIRRAEVAACAEGIAESVVQVAGGAEIDAGEYDESDIESMTQDRWNEEVESWIQYNVIPFDEDKEISSSEVFYL